MFLQKLGQIQITGNLSGTCFFKIVKITICLCSVVCFAVPLCVLTERRWGGGRMCLCMTQAMFGLFAGTYGIPVQVLAASEPSPRWHVVQPGSSQLCSHCA